MLDVVNFPHLKDPRIGVLIREGRQIYYAHIDGEFPERATADEILVLLGVIPAPEPAPVLDAYDTARYYTPSIAPDLYADEKPGTRGAWRDIRVKIVNLDIPWEAPGYFVVRAKSNRSAISRARKEMRSPDIHHTRREGRLRYSIDEDY
jgi:hypothetical protein